MVAFPEKAPENLYPEGALIVFRWGLIVTPDLIGDILFIELWTKIPYSVSSVPIAVVLTLVAVEAFPVKVDPANVIALTFEAVISYPAAFIFLVLGLTLIGYPLAFNVLEIIFPLASTVLLTNISFTNLGDWFPAVEVPTNK